MRWASGDSGWGSGCDARFGLALVESGATPEERALVGVAEDDLDCEGHGGAHLAAELQQAVLVVEFGTVVRAVGSVVYVNAAEVVELDRGDGLVASGVELPGLEVDVLQNPHRAGCWCSGVRGAA